jgi:hypothetical protein
MAIPTDPLICAPADVSNALTFAHRDWITEALALAPVVIVTVWPSPPVAFRL